jgi:hypothetical protein
MFESGDEFDLGAAMAAMGVKPLGKSDGATRVRNRKPEASHKVKASTTIRPDDKTIPTKSPIDFAKRCSELEQELSNSNDELMEARATISLMKSELRNLSDELISRPSFPVEQTSEVGVVQSILRERGLRGRLEFGELFTVLVNSKRLFDIFPDLSTANPNALRHLLASNIVLHCGQVECEVKGSVLTVTVASDRCEMCGGGGQSSTPIDQMSEALMLHGFTRVAVVTKHLAPAKALRAGIHGRINLTILPVGVSGDLFTREQLVIDWGEHPPSSTKLDGKAVILRCKVPLVSELSKRVCSFLQKLDKR